jgi:hypothetical protein
MPRLFFKGTQFSERIKNETLEKEDFSRFKILYELPLSTTKIFDIVLFKEDNNIFKAVGSGL